MVITSNQREALVRNLLLTWGSPRRIPPRSHLLSYFVVRMIWWFVILGVSTLVVVFVAIVLFIRLRRHLQASHAGREDAAHEADYEHQSKDADV